MDPPISPDHVCREKGKKKKEGKGEIKGFKAFYFSCLLIKRLNVIKQHNMVSNYNR